MHPTFSAASLLHRPKLLASMHCPFLTQESLCCEPPRAKWQTNSHSEGRGREFTVICERHLCIIIVTRIVMTSPVQSSVNRRGEPFHSLVNTGQHWGHTYSSTALSSRGLRDVIALSLLHREWILSLGILLVDPLPDERSLGITGLSYSQSLLILCTLVSCNAV